MVLMLITFVIVLLPVNWQEVDLSFISRDFQEVVNYSFILPSGYKQIIDDPGEDGRQTIMFTYPSGATFYITNDSNCHPNYFNIRKRIPVIVPWADSFLVDNEVLMDPSIQQEYCIPDNLKYDYSGYSIRSSWWRDIQTFDISYGYLHVKKKVESLVRANNRINERNTGTSPLEFTHIAAHPSIDRPLSAL